jgi:hypothetical protein
VEGGARAFGFAFDVEGAGDFERLWVERDDRVKLRALLVVGVDAREVELDEFFGGERA